MLGKIFKTIIFVMLSGFFCQAFAGNVFSAIADQHEASQQSQAQVPVAPPTVQKPTLKKQGTIDKIIAIVNSDVITESELDAKIALAMNDMRGSGAEMPSMDVIRNQVLHNMIDVTLQLQLAKRANVSITNDDVDKAVTTIAKRNDASVAKLREELNKQGIDYGEFREQIREQMIIGRVEQAAFGHTITVSQTEVDKALASYSGSDKPTRTEMRNKIYQKKFVKKLKSWVKNLRDTAYIKINP